jgi:peptide chain release factor 1
MTPQVHDKLKAVAARYDELARLVSDPAVQANQQTYKTHAKELSELESLVDAHRRYDQLADQLAQAREVASSADADMKELAE